MKKLSLLIAALVLFSAAYGREVVKRNSYREFQSRSSRGGSGQYKYINGSTVDSVKILALLVEFQSDSVSNTTGTGLFGFRTDSLNPSFEDAQEQNWYKSDSVYTYDALPHNGRYFDNHLKFVQNYYEKVSGGNLKIGYELFPKQDNKLDNTYPDAYQVRLDMARYSPGQKRKSESTLDFSIRRTTSLLRFIKDAIVVADTAAGAQEKSPFYGLTMDERGTLWDITDEGDSTKVFVLIFHAGSNYLTDGGGNAASANSPSDMSDLFVSQDFFSDFYDAENDTIFKGFAKEYNDFVGVSVQGDSSNTLISEVMLCAETSNQDSLNFGINGLLVNLLARQMGVPTLHNKSGFSATGKFGIMDYSGYSAGQGFIPPFPSAFVRAFMGWSKPTFLTEGSAPLTAVGKSGVSGDSESDILLVPINDNEYWLIENRQRNLETSDPFRYDTTDNVTHIGPNGKSFDFDLDKLNLQLSSTSNVIINASNFDIGIGGSGCLVWHIDEKIIDARQELDILNSDSTYRAVALEEADGINDIGIYFVNALQQRIDDYGGSEDIFPHYASFDKGNIRNSMSATTMPSTAANDGGNTFISLTISPTDVNKKEKYLYQKSNDTKYEKYFVDNFSNRNMTITVANKNSQSPIVRKTPLQLSDAPLVDLFYFNVVGDASTPDELITIDSLGNLCIITGDNEIITDSTNFTTVTPYYNSSGTLTDTVFVTAKIPAPAQTPTVIDNQFAIPHKDGTISFWQSGTIPAKQIETGYNFSTVISAHGANWMIGTKQGRVLFGAGSDTTGSLLIGTDDAVTAIAQFNKQHGIFAAITQSGKVILCTPSLITGALQLPLKEANLQGPFSLIAGNLDGKGEIEIVVTDKIQKLWILKADSTGATFNSEIQQSHFAGYFTDTYTGYAYTQNSAAPSLVDLNSDGNLDILVPGTNGVYAFNHKAVLLDDWPAILDQREWYLRKSVTTSPLTISKNDSVMTLFSTLTGDNGTFYVSKIDSVKDDPHNAGKKIIYYKDEFATIDSSLGITTGFVDTLLNINDSAVFLYNAPGGLIDLRNAKGDRQVSQILSPFSDTIRFSLWPLTLGAPGSLTPLIADLDKSDTLLTLAAINSKGTLYQWKISSNEYNLGNDNAVPHWSCVGGDLQRSFSRSVATAVSMTAQTVTNFYTYPNPAKLYEGRDASVRFRYDLGTDAEEVRLTIYTVSGIKVFDSADLPTESGTNEFVLPNLDNFGSALYRCKINASFGDKEVHSFWKMVILRGTL